jgi:hypothetical protein
MNTRKWKAAKTKVLAAMVLSIIVSFFFPSAGKFAYPVATWGGLLYLYIIALKRADKNAMGFTLTTAAESAYTCSIMFLVGGVILLMITGIRGGMNMSEFTFDSISPLLWPFVEGLFSTVLALHIADDLRLTEKERGTIIGTGADGKVYDLPIEGGAEIGAAVGRLLAAITGAAENMEKVQMRGGTLGEAISTITPLLQNLGTLIEHLRFFMPEAGAARKTESPSDGR